jgi:hypothetical protein
MGRGRVTTGRVYDVVFGSKNASYAVYYEYYVDSVRYDNNRSFATMSNELQFALQDELFPVIYLPEEPGVSSILMTEDAFKAVGREFPDSLKWVENMR